jgi:hypothetical protein
MDAVCLSGRTGCKVCRTGCGDWVGFARTACLPWPGRAIVPMTLHRRGATTPVSAIAKSRRGLSSLTSIAGRPNRTTSTRNPKVAAAQTTAEPSVLKITKNRPFQCRFRDAANVAAKHYLVGGWRRRNWRIPYSSGLRRPCWRTRPSTACPDCKQLRHCFARGTRSDVRICLICRWS